MFIRVFQVLLFTFNHRKIRVKESNSSPSCIYQYTDNLLRRNEKFERSISQQGNSEVMGRATNGGLEDQANKARIQMIFANTKSHNKSKYGIRTKNWEVQRARKLSLEFLPRAEERPASSMAKAPTNTQEENLERGSRLPADLQIW